jgi:hypothetical protein
VRRMQVNLNAVMVLLLIILLGVILLLFGVDFSAN